MWVLVIYTFAFPICTAAVSRDGGHHIHTPKTWYLTHSRSNSGSHGTLKIVAGTVISAEYTIPRDGGLQGLVKFLTHN